LKILKFNNNLGKRISYPLFIRYDIPMGQSKTFQWRSVDLARNWCETNSFIGLLVGNSPSGFERLLWVFWW